MSGPLSPGAFSAVVRVDFRRIVFETGKERPLEYDKVFNIHDMDWNPLTDQQYAGLGTMPAKPVGTAFKLDEPIQGSTKSYEAVPFGLAVELPWELWRDDNYGAMQEMMKDLARASRNRQEVDAWSVLNNAFDTGVNGFTAGEALCSTSHVSFADGHVQANRPSPDIAFSVTGIMNAHTRFEGMTTARNMPRLMAPVMHIIGKENKFVAREILGSSGKPYTADNEINALIDEDMSYMVCHYFTSLTQWFTLAAKGVHDLNFEWRDHPIQDAFDDPRTKNAVMTIYQRHTKGYGSWEGTDGSRP